MIIPILFSCVGAILLVFFCIKRVKGATPFVAMIKALASFCFIATALSSIAFGACDAPRLRFTFFMVMGLVCGAYGDIALDLKYAHRKSEATYTNAGFISFLFGHIFYDIGLVSEFYVKGNAKVIIIPTVISIAVVIGMYFSEKLMKLDYGQYRLIVSVYSAFLISLGAFSFSMAKLHGFRNVGLDIIFGGSIFFMISDFILSGTYFGQGKNRPVDIVTNHVTYYIAQYAIALSLCFCAN